MLDKIISKLLKKSRSKFAFKQDIFKKLEILHLEERITPASLLGINKFQQIDDAVKQAIINSGNKCIFTIPYTPKTNCIEQYFNQIKHYLKLNKKVLKYDESVIEIKNAIKQVKREN